MKLQINDKLLKDNNITHDEFFLLYLIAKEANITELLENLIEKGIVKRDLFNKYNAVMTNSMKALVNSILINSHPKVENNDKWYMNLAEAMQKAYPGGRKAGTTYSWRGSTKIIADRLKKVAIKFDTEFTEKEVVEVTEHFVKGFSDYTYMPLLQYFIYKENSNRQFTSRFMEEIELYRENEQKYLEQRLNDPKDAFGDLI